MAESMIAASLRCRNDVISTHCWYLTLEFEMLFGEPYNNHGVYSNVIFMSSLNGNYDGMFFRKQLFFCKYFKNYFIKSFDHIVLKLFILFQDNIDIIQANTIIKPEHVNK